jgi:hypothetical protein
MRVMIDDKDAIAQAVWGRNVHGSPQVAGQLQQWRNRFDGRGLVSSCRLCSVQRARVAGNISYTGAKVRHSCNTVVMLSLEALHVNVAETIMPKCGISGRNQSKGGGVMFFHSTGTVEQRKDVEAVSAGS